MNNRIHSVVHLSGWTCVRSFAVVTAERFLCRRVLPSAVQLNVITCNAIVKHRQF